MKYVSAYMLASIGGNANPSAQDVLKILEAGGLETDKANAERVVKLLHGKKLADLITEGSKNLVAVSGGGGGAAAAPAASAAPAAAAEAPKDEGKKKKEEPKEESDDDMGFGLFD